MRNSRLTNTLLKMRGVKIKLRAVVLIPLCKILKLANLKIKFMCVYIIIDGNNEVYISFIISDFLTL